MTRAIDCVSALALVSALSACNGREEAANQSAAANDMNAATPDFTGLANNEVAAPGPTAPSASEEALVAKAAPAKPAPAPAPAPAKPKPAEPAGETPDPSCTPEHRAAGHC